MTFFSPVPHRGNNDPLTGFLSGLLTAVCVICLVSLASFVSSGTLCGKETELTVQEQRIPDRG